MNLRTVIIDDEKNAREALLGVLESNYPEINIVGQADGVFSGLQLIEKLQPDLVFLDIKMKDGTGFDLLSRLSDISFSLVFLTAYDEYALKAFRFSATDYLLKPIDPDDLDEALRRVKKKQDNQQLNIEALLNNLQQKRDDEKKVVLKTAEAIHIIKVAQIISCTASGNYTEFTIHGRKTLLVSKPLKEFDELLTPMNFFRPHQSHLVNLAHIEHVDKKDGYTIIMTNGSQLPVATRKREALLKKLEEI